MQVKQYKEMLYMYHKSGIALMKASMYGSGPLRSLFALIAMPSSGERLLTPDIWLDLGQTSLYYNEYFKTFFL